MRVDATEKIVTRLLLIGLCTAGAACGERLLPAVSGSGGAGPGVGGAAYGGVGGSGLTGVGGVPGTGGQGGGAEPFNPDGWQVFRHTTTAGKLDLLFMIDNSQSMLPLQNKLLASFPVLMNALKALPTGLPDIHVAVISSDTGPGKYDLPDIHCSYLGDQGMFQTQARGACSGSPLPAGQTFLQASDNQAQKNYAGDITDAFTCIAALGDGGCGFEGQLKSVRWALDPQNVPNGNQGFLRDDATLAVVLLTNEDDCSVPDDSDLVDPTQEHMSDPYGPLWSFRCNEFGHLCNIGGVLRHPVRGVNMNLSDCISDDTATGKETKVADEIAFLKSLKPDPSQLLVAALTGPTTPYNVDMQTRTLSDGTQESQPNTDHSCMQTTGEYADPAIRIHQWVQAFGDNGLTLSICADSFTPALNQLATSIRASLASACVTGPFFQSDPNSSCTVVDLYASGSTTTEVHLPNCAVSGPSEPCWTLAPAADACPLADEQQLIVNRFGAPPPAQGTAITCPMVYPG